MKDLAQARQYAKEVREWRKAHGMCVRCGKEKAVKGQTLCLVCKMDNRERHKEKYRNMPVDEKKALLDKKREQKKAIAEEKRKNGICLQCSKPRYKNHAYCYEHYLSQKRVHRKVNEQKKKDHNACGLCRICDKPKLKNSAFCEEHYNEYSTRMREYNYKRAKEREETKDNERNQG